MLLSVYIREQKAYKYQELRELLALTEEGFLPFMERLRSYGIVKPVPAALGEEALSGLDGDLPGVYAGDGQEQVYVFTFVGIVQAGERILKCCPKYLDKENPFQEMKQILKVLRRYHSRRQELGIYRFQGREGAFHRLGVMLYLVEDYLEHGAYTSWQPVTELNGSGEIFWDRTIHETVALTVGGRPFYPELLTAGSNDDEHDYFRRLHRCIVTECSRSLEEAGLTGLLELERLYESDEVLEDLGDEEMLLYRIGRELDVQFDDRRCRILELMDTYIAHRQMPEEGSGLYLLGTSHFETVWEAVCAQTMKNCLGRPLGSPYAPGQTLLGLIERPRWRYQDSSDRVTAPGTLVPDLVTVYENQGRRVFAILDAKYYRICLERGRVSGQPGIADITKQYLYQLAFQDFIRDMGYDCVQNAFLFPGCGQEPEYLGRAELSMLAGAGPGGLSHIAAVRLPAGRLYDAYIAGREEEPARLLACVPED